MTEDLGLTALCNAKAKLDVAIREGLDRVAILRKRAEGLQVAIDLLRSSDAELRSILSEPIAVTGTQHEASDEEIERAIIEYLGTVRSAQVKYIARMVNGKLQASRYRIDKILRMCPSVISTGKGPGTRWELKPVAPIIREG